MELHVFLSSCPPNSLTQKFERIRGDRENDNDEDRLSSNHWFPCILESMPNYAKSYIKTITNMYNCCLVISANNLTEEYSLMILKLQELINRQTNMHGNQIIRDA